MSDPEAQTFVISLDGWAHGGEAVGRLPDGRACFVPYAIPGETVEVRIRTQHKRHVTADLLNVVEPSPHRVQPPCPYYGSCGGCQLQHVAVDHQLSLKQRVLTEQLQRIGKEADPPVRGVSGPVGAWPQEYRVWARMAVDPQGRLGFRMPRSHQVQAVAECLLFTPETQRLRETAGDDWAGADEVMLMAGDGGTMISVSGPAQVAGSSQGSVRMQVGAENFTASAGAFFQAGPAGALALAQAVIRVAEVRAGDRVLDLYSGVGLLSVFLARAGASVVAVESNAVAAADAVSNCANQDVTVLTATVEEALAGVSMGGVSMGGVSGDVDLVVLDPPRSGAKAQVCSRMADLAPRRIIYVACDPAALARDTLTLRQHGYRLTSVDGLDLFGHTAHVEAVASFVQVG
ncbi:MAG: class I SAM-dependent RNA methyltransferase [Euzebya sp.]